MLFFFLSNKDKQDTNIKIRHIIIISSALFTIPYISPADWTSIPNNAILDSFFIPTIYNNFKRRRYAYGLGFKKYTKPSEKPLVPIPISGTNFLFEFNMILNLE